MVLCSVLVLERQAGVPVDLIDFGLATYSSAGFDVEELGIIQTEFQGGGLIDEGNG